jgi:hypothetical protein
MCAMKQMYLPLHVVILCTLLSIQTAQAQCGLAGSATAGANGDNNTIGGSLSWSGTGNTTSLDGSYANATPLAVLLGTVPTNYLTLNQFGFNIPNGYTICGVGLSISRGTNVLLSLNGSVTDNVVQLATINGVNSLTLLGSNQAATSTAWPYASIGTAIYGGGGNTMGATLTPAIVSATNFGVAISANINTLLGVLIGANIDKVSMSIYTNPLIILPITLENFTVGGEGTGNAIRWTANADEIANQFIVQRSADGNTWQDLATLPATTGTESYSYTDANPLAGLNYYRLALVNTDGTTGYSITAIVSSKSAAPGIHFYPNPFHDMINITASGTFTRLSLKDIAGRTLWVKEYPGGISSVQIAAGDLPPGLYFITVDGTTYKLVKN